MTTQTTNGKPITQSDTHLRSILKGLSWRILSTMVTLIISYAFTKKAAVAAAIAGTDMLINFLLYYLHERGWNLLRWGKVIKGS